MKSEATVDKKTAEHTAPSRSFGAPFVYVLNVIAGEDPGAVHRISRPETFIGRGDAIDFRVEDIEISKQHCSVRVDGSVCTIVDLDSLNGTFLNGQRLRRGVAERLRHLDEIRIGNTRIFVLSGRFKDRPVRKADDPGESAK